MDATNFLKDPKLLLKVEDDLNTFGIVGEDKLKVLIYLIATARRMPKGLGARIQSESAAGKSYLVDAIKSLMPPEDVIDTTRLSSKALYYMGEDSLRHKLVLVKEAIGVSEIDYPLRNLISELFISCYVPIEKKGKRFETQQFKVYGPISYIDTTTDFKINPENATRIFELYMDESEQQTQTIHDWQRTEAGFESMYAEEKRNQIRLLHQETQKLLRTDVDVTIPYARHIKFPTQHVRMRRDFPKFLNLIKVIAFLHQYQRRIEKIPGVSPLDDSEYIVANLFDYELAHSLIHQVFVDTLNPLTKPESSMLKCIEEHLKQTGKPIDTAVFTVYDVVKWIGKARSTATGILGSLEKQGFITRLIKITGVLATYKFNKSEFEKIKKETLSFEITTPDELGEKIKKKAKNLKGSLDSRQVDRSAQNTVKPLI